MTIVSELDTHNAYVMITGTYGDLHVAHIV